MNPITNRAHSTKNPPDPTRIPRIPTSGQHSEIYPQKPIPNPPAFITNPSKNANVFRLRNKINHSALHDTPHSVSRMTPKRSFATKHHATQSHANTPPIKNTQANDHNTTRRARPPRNQPRPPKGRQPRPPPPPPRPAIFCSTTMMRVATRSCTRKRSANRTNTITRKFLYDF